MNKYSLTIRTEDAYPHPEQYEPNDLNCKRILNTDDDQDESEFILDFEKRGDLIEFVWNQVGVVIEAYREHDYSGDWEDYVLTPIALAQEVSMIIGMETGLEDLLSNLEDLWMGDGSTFEKKHQLLDKYQEDRE